MKALLLSLVLLGSAVAFSPTGSAQRATAARTSDAGEDDSTLTGVRLHADPRLAVLVKKATNIKRGIIRSGKGFRVQIYAGNDRAAATRTKLDFMRRFPGVRTYMTYAAPQFRVKVGDFSTRADAQRLASQVSGLYRPVMIVPDLIVVNTLRNGD